MSYWQAVEEMHRWARPVAAWWEDHDLLVTPTSPAIAPPLGAGDDYRTVAYTLPFNITGQPAVSLPVHNTIDGVPVGAQLVGGYGREDVVLAAAGQVMDLI